MRSKLFVSINLTLLAVSVFAAPAPSLFEDRKARVPGDIITIQIVENSTASVSARTNTKAEYNAEVDASGSGALDFIPLLGGSGSTTSEHKGDARTSRAGSLRATLTAKVVEVFPNGNMRIEGQKTLMINGDKQLTILTGVIRPEDISSDNSISSDLIADAQITFKGKGILANSEHPGIFARIFDWIF